jgi:hypothetical protein
MNLNYGYQQKFNQYRPNLQILNKGYGIDQNEFNNITNCCINSYLNNAYPLSTNSSNAIKRAIGGEWFVCASPINSKDYDFSLTSARTDDQLTFSVDGVLFQVCRLK